MRLLPETASSSFFRNRILASLSDFAKQLYDMAPAIKQYADEIKDFKDTGAVDASAKAITILAKAEEGLRGHDGLKQWVEGDAKLSDFAKELPDVGDSIVKFTKAVAPLNDSTNATQNASSAIVKPCKAGYERNPDTNRCRKIVAATNQLKPCKDGYERNPDTNRCRKIKPINNSAEYPVENSYNQSVKPANLAAFSTFGAATIAATAYTGYQFRHRIRKIITKILSGYQ